MKQKDLALIAVIIIISATLSVFISQAIIVPPKNRQQKVEVVGVISPDFPEPDSKHFNQSAINPTRRVTIGTNSNPDPFNSAKQ
ncbi:MAG TPA: hypothetical protein VJC09_01625 [Candidatus Saccharimonadales bacterium]|nr:hypothetical protein [Candidatus Saccharimonadales bacterium]